MKQQIDYNQVVTGDKLDYITYENKFKVWDEVDKKSDKAILLLEDPTIYAYAFFRNDKDEPLKLTAYQDAMVNCKHDFTPDNPNRYILYKSANQMGKSTALCLLAIHHAINEKNVNIVMISKSLPQSHFLLASIRHLLNNSAFAETWKEGVGETANTTILTFERDGGKAVNRIICTPAGEGTLGYPVHYLFADEFDFYEEGKTFFWKVAFPRCGKTKGQIICFSNPNPDISRNNSILYELWTGDLFQRKFHFKFLDAPWNTEKEYEVAKRNSISRIFASTHDGEFPDESGSFFTYKEIQDMLKRDWRLDGLPSVDRPVYIALDLGKMYDQSVISIGISKKPENPDDKYSDLDVVYTEEFQIGTEYDKVVKRYCAIRDYYEQNYKGVAGFGFDATGQQTFYDFIKSLGITSIPVDFAKKETNKTLLFNDFKLMAEKRKIKIAYSEKCEKQLSSLVFKETELKKLKVEAAKEKLHDDYPSSLAILIHIAVRPSHVPVTFTSIEKPKEIAEDFRKMDTRSIVEMNTIMQDRQSYFDNKLNEYGGGFGW